MVNVNQNMDIFFVAGWLLFNSIIFLIVTQYACFSFRSIMVPLNLRFRSLTFLFLITSFCLTYIVQLHIRNTAPDSYYIQQHRILPTSRFWLRYININIRKYNLNSTRIHGASYSLRFQFRMCPSRISAASPPPQPNSPSNDDQLPWNIIDYDYYDDDDDDETEEYTWTRYSGLAPSSETRFSHGTIVGIALGIAAMVVLVAMVMFLAGCLYNGAYRKKISLALLKNAQVQLMSTKASNGGGLAVGLEGITVDKTVEFAYEELSKATHDFRLGNKIGQGGFGSVYYAELRGQKAAIKKMGMQASKEFVAELKVLTRVHHLNLVRLIGYCTVERSHFLIYEYIENGNLSQHLHGSGRDPLSWSIRLQIALDSARGLEYMHEYTVPIFIHCDIKSANILIDKNFNGKVGDFGLTRLTEVRSRSRLVGTFGYMAPEYAQYGDVSPKVDVYAFGVVLYELISAKTAIIRANDSAAEPKGLIALFDEVLSEAESKDDLLKMIDPRLGDNYHLDSVYKVAQLAKACTQAVPHQRPSMRSIVVALMTLVLSTED